MIPSPDELRDMTQKARNKQHRVKMREAEKKREAEEREYQAFKDSWMPVLQQRVENATSEFANNGLSKANIPVDDHRVDWQLNRRLGGELASSA